MSRQMKNINFGCGLSPSQAVEWINYDGSPTLRLQRLPIVGPFFKQFLKPQFPRGVRYADVAKGLPHENASVDLVYCSHVLEHLAVDDVRSTLKEVHRVLKPGGIFRGVMPDLAYEVLLYNQSESLRPSIDFTTRNDIGMFQRPRNIFDRIKMLLGNSKHLSFWDFTTFKTELNTVGFVQVRRAYFGDSAAEEFKSCEDITRWRNCLGFEATKPLC